MCIAIYTQRQFSPAPNLPLIGVNSFFIRHKFKILQRCKFWIGINKINSEQASEIESAKAEVEKFIAFSQLKSVCHCRKSSRCCAQEISETIKSDLWFLILSEMYSYNRIHNDYDNNVVRVELNSSYRPRMTKAVSREPMRVTTSINRNDTFTRHDKPSNIVRSETFILKHHDESSDERPDYNTYTRSKKKSHGTAEKRHDDKSNYSTYTRSEKKGNEFFLVECL